MIRNKELYSKKQKITSNRKRKKDMDIDGWLKLLSCPSKECLANI